MSDKDELIKIEIGDAQDFIKGINNIITSLIAKFQFDEVFIIRIRNWFDHKWLNFSGKSVVQFHGGNFIESSLQDEWRDKITIPPFNPNRVLSETFFKINPSEDSVFKKTIHTAKTSNDNIHNRIVNYSKNGLFVWFSSNTDTNQKGSIMVYNVQNGTVLTFYASFENNKCWKIKQTKDIATNELADLLSLKYN